MVDPEVGVVRDRTRQPGLSCLAELREGLVLEHVPLSVALRTEYDFDAHFVLYHAEDEDGASAFLRINKRCAAPSEIEAAGGRIAVPLLALDFDLDGKRAWVDRAEVEDFCAGLAGRAIPEPTVFYSTRHGARFVYVLTEPVAPERAEELARGLWSLFRAAGVALDETCSDWTRLFRLPRVTRDDRPTWHDPAFLVEESDATLDPATVPAAPRAFDQQADAFAPADVDVGPMPDADECRALLVGPAGKPTEWAKTAKRYLKGRDCWPYVFEAAPVRWPVGERNDTLVRMVGSACGLLYHREGTTPERVFSLFSDLVDQLEPDAGTRDWRAAAWSILGRMWQSEVSKHAARDVQRVAAQEEAGDLRTRIVQALREQFPEQPELADEGSAVAWADKRMVAAAPKGLYVMRRDGSYSPVPVGKDRLVSMIRHLGMDSIIPTTEMRNNVWRARDAQDIINEHAVPVKRVECSPRVAHAHIRGEGADRVLVLKVHRLREMEGARDPQVEHWLKLLFGEQHDAAIEWLAHSLDVSWGICALVLIGASGTGKGMLVQGLAENFENPAFNDGRALGRFNVGLLENPVVCLDEGIPNTASEGRRPDEVIRALTVGGNLAIEPKGLDVIHAQIYPRLVITSNSWDAVQQIAGSRDLSEQDIYALETRLLVVHVGEDARRWLTANGNYAFTKGWVEGSVPSTYRVARHVRWLYERRALRGQGSGRLLVEGHRNTDLMRELSMRTPIAQAVIRAIVQALEDGGTQPGIWVDPGGHVWVVPHGIVAYHEKRLMQHNRVELSSKSVARVLRKLCLRELPNARSLPGQPDAADKQRWWEVNVEVLLYEALHSGQPRRKLRELFAQQNGSEALAMVEAAFDREEARHGAE